MFNKKRKNNIKNPFGDRNYKMKECYDAEVLVVANLERISGMDSDSDDLVVETTKQKYIFEIINDGEQLKYREIFTGFITSDVGESFDLPYVVNQAPITDFFPDAMGCKFPKLSLIWAINDINFPKKQEEVFKLEKK